MLHHLKPLALAGGLAVLCLGGTAQAGWIVGLVDGKTIVTIDPATRKVTTKVDVKGAAMLVGIDVRPADGMLYGLAADGAIVTIDVKTGQATVKSKLSETLKPGVVIVDFNPVADRLRVIESDGTNLRVNVEDGKATVDGALKFKEGDPNAGKTPMVVAGAYTNSRQGPPKTTALYDIDAATGSLLMQAPPNDGVLNTVGSLGFPVSGPVAFNIVASGDDKNDAWLANGGALFSVDLKTGKATMVGKFDGLSGSLTDIAWMD